MSIYLKNCQSVFLFFRFFSMNILPADWSDVTIDAWLQFIFFFFCLVWVIIIQFPDKTYSLRSTPNDRFFEKLFMAILFTLRVFVRNLLRRNRRRNTFRISFWCLAWDTNPDFSSNKPTHYPLEHGNFKLKYSWFKLEKGQHNICHFQILTVKRIHLFPNCPPLALLWRFINKKHHKKTYFVICHFQILTIKRIHSFQNCPPLALLWRFINKKYYKKIKKRLVLRVWVKFPSFIPKYNSSIHFQRAVSLDNGRGLS